MVWLEDEVVMEAVRGVIAGDRMHELDDSLRMVGGIICLNDDYFIQMTTRGVASIT
jgi:hypothetical protein